jgi:hypothetical protein
MKIIYSIFESAEEATIDLIFRILINKEDYILLKKFRDTRFIANCMNIDPDYIQNYEGNALFEDKIYNGPYSTIVVKWGKDHINEIKKEERLYDDYLWDTKEYKLTYSNIGEIDHDKVIQNIIKNVTQKMEEIVKNKRPEDKSCFQKIADIHY